MSTVSEKKKKTWIAISGMMGSGKSTLISYLKDKGYVVFDCDQINKELQEKGEKGYLQLVERLGDCILDENQNIDKKKLADLIFNDSTLKEEIEQILHPLILNKLQEYHEIYDFMFVEVPLLYEINWQSYFDNDWFVYADVDTIKRRCMENRHMSEEEVDLRLENQMDMDTKCQKARVVLYNKGTLEEFYREIDKNLEVLG